MTRERSSRATTRLARGLAMAVLAGGLIASWAASHVSQKRHAMETAAIFFAECDAMRSAVEQEVALFFDVLASIGQLHELSDSISAEDFEEFTQKGLQFQKRILGAYGFVQRLPDSIRQALEAEPAAGPAILETGPDGSFVRAVKRPEYYPIVYQQPVDAFAMPKGTDMATLPGMQDAIVQMNERMGPVVASSVQLQDSEGRTGYFVLSPLFQVTREARAVFSGFTIAALWPQRILRQALDQTSVRDVLVRFHDPRIVPPETPSSDRLHYEQTLMVADRPWRFEAEATPEYLAARRSLLPGVILAAGTALTLLGSVTLMLLANRTRHIERVVQERTRALKDANAQLSDSMRERMRLESEILDISEREKQQLGHDLHDSLGQKLTGAVFLSRALTGRLAGADEEAQAQAGKITDILKDAVAQVRRMARGLSPVELGKEGLAGALHRLAEETSAVYGITCLFHHAHDTQPPARAAHQLYAIAMEAVNNAVKHGGAKEIVIEWSTADSAHRLAIEDDGKGFDEAALRDRGMGLRIMKYRASMIGGELTITRRPEGGMAIACTLPA